jgi:hypothetical protein
MTIPVILWTRNFLPDAIKGTKLYDPANNASEARIREYLRNCWKEKIWVLIGYTNPYCRKDLGKVKLPVLSLYNSNTREVVIAFNILFMPLAIEPHFYCFFSAIGIIVHFLQMN